MATAYRSAAALHRSSHSFRWITKATRDGPSLAGCSITLANQNNRGTPLHRGQLRASKRAAPLEGGRDVLINLTYISDSRIPSGDVAVEIEAILACASERNVRDQITGVLLFTGTRFVQTLEGTAASVEAMLVSIARDPRHSALTIIDRHDVPARNFQRWSLTYPGPSLFIARAVARGLADFHGGRSGETARLLRMMLEFGAAPPLRPGS